MQGSLRVLDMLKIAPLLALIVFLPAVAAASTHSDESQTDDLADAHDKITRYMQAQSDAIITHSSQQRQQPDIADELPVFMSFVNQTSNELVVGLDLNATGTAEQYLERIRQITNGSAVPVRLVSGHFVEESCDAVNDRCDPLIGGIEISTFGGIGVLTLPVINNNNERGFVMSGHVAGPAQSDRKIWQPKETNPIRIEVGVVATNPLNPRSSDSAFVRTLDSIALEQKIFNPDGDPYDVVGTKISEVHDIVYMAGIINKTIGSKNYTTTSGGVLSTGVTIDSPMYGTLTDQNTAGYMSASGDNGAPVYSLDSGNGVLLHGIHVGKSCFSDFPPTINSAYCKYLFPVYSPWEHVRSELNLKPVTGSLEAPTSLSEPFDDLDVWTEEGETGWSTGSPDEGGHPPGHPAATNTVAEADDCDSECRLVLSYGLDLTGYDSAAMTLYRYVDDDLDGGEYLRVDVSEDGGASWINAYDWQGNRDDDDTWTKHTLDLADHLDSDNFKIRLAARASSSSEYVMVDTIIIEGQQKAVPAHLAFENNLSDSGTGGHDGTVRSGSVSYGAGAVGQAVTLNNDHLTLAGESNFDYDTDDAFSIAFWIKKQSVPTATESLVSKSERFWRQGIDVWMNHNAGGKASFRLSDGSAYISSSQMYF